MDSRQFRAVVFRLHCASYLIHGERPGRSIILESQFEDWFAAAGVLDKSMVL